METSPTDTSATLDTNRAFRCLPLVFHMRLLVQILIVFAPVILQSIIAVSAIATSATLDTTCVFRRPCCICPDSVPLASSLCTTINMQLLHGMRSMGGLCGVSLVAISSLALDLLQGRHRPSAQHLDGSCSTILWMISPTRGYSNGLLTRSTDRSSTHTERN